MRVTQASCKEILSTCGSSFPLRAQLILIGACCRLLSMAEYGALATIDPSAIIQRIAAGEYQSHIAHELGVAPQSLHRQIRDLPEYRLALEARNLAKLDNAQERIDSSDADLARAREAFRAAAWRAERECPAIWGAKQQVQVSGSVTLDLVLSGMQSLDDMGNSGGNLIDGQSESAEESES